MKAVILWPMFDIMFHVQNTNPAGEAREYLEFNPALTKFADPRLMMIGSKSKPSQVKFINLKEGYEQEGYHLKPSCYKRIDYKKRGSICTMVCFISLLCLVTILFVLYGKLEADMRGICKEVEYEIQYDYSQVSKFHDDLETSQERIAELEKKNLQLKDSLEEMQGRLTKMETREYSLEEAPVRPTKFETSVYELKLTPRKGTFYEVREMCQQMGGDLMQKTLLTNTPGNYREKIRSFGVTTQHKYLFIGITDLEVEGTWKFLNGEDFIEANSISYWNRDSNEPNGGRRENCGTAVLYGQPGSPHADPSVPYPYFRINDYYCTDYIIYGICEILNISLIVPY